MAQTCEQVRQHIGEIDNLVGALILPPSASPAVFDDVRWLLAKRRDLVSLLSFRRSLARGKVVDLQAWRTGIPAP